MRYKPYFLPQVGAPVEVVMEQLEAEGIDCELLNIGPDELKPMQGIVFSDEINEIDIENMNPIWVSKDDEVIDGHHRYIKALMENKPIKCVKIDLNGKDSARVLNKIQDIYEYVEQQKMEEVVLQDTINSDNNSDDGISTNEFLASLEAAEMPKGDGCKVIAYRQKPIMENSVVGNFFILQPINGYDKYEIEFENMLDTNELGLEFADQNPVDVLSKMWFPNTDFENLSAPFNHSPVDLKNKAIAEKAQKLGYDGIKYGDKMIQGLK